jgi:hypothetical protein
MNRTQICVPFGSPFVRYALRDPSGDQTELETSTTYRLREPSAFVIQREDSHRVVSLSTHRRVADLLAVRGEPRVLRSERWKEKREQHDAARGEDTHTHDHLGLAREGECADLVAHYRSNRAQSCPLVIAGVA